MQDDLHLTSMARFLKTVGALKIDKKKSPKIRALHPIGLGILPIAIVVTITSAVIQAFKEGEFDFMAWW